MRLPALIHLVGAVQALSRCDRVRVLGSSALLASFPTLGEAGGPLEISYDADLLVEPCDDDLAAVLDEALGQGSRFEARFGCYADILRPSIKETLPPGWEARTVALGGTSGNVAALAPEDLCVVKLRVGRDKDLALCGHLLATGGERTRSAVERRLMATPLDAAETVTVYRRWRSLTDLV